MNDPEYSDGGAHRDNDAGHYEYKIGNNLGNYKIVSHLGDGTFGRTLKCQNLRDQQYYAVKIIRAVKRYNSSAKIEIKILNDLKSKGGDAHHLVLLHESFIHKEDGDDHTCLVFETLGKSLYEFVKGNKYQGFGLN
jgi:dual-specificity kinase